MDKCVGIYLVIYTESNCHMLYERCLENQHCRSQDNSSAVLLCAVWASVSELFCGRSSKPRGTVSAIQQYFVCEAVGSGTECDHSGFDNFGYGGLTVLAYLMLGFVPAVNLTFVINWTAARASCKHFWMKHFLKTTISQVIMENNQNNFVL